MKVLSIDGASYDLTVPFLLKRVCSNITMVGVDVLSRKGTRRERGPAGDRLRISAPKIPLYGGERFWLQASGRMPSLAPPQMEECPKLLVWQRAPDGRTTLEEATPENFRGCPSSWWFPHPHGGWRSGFEMSLSGQSGENRVQVFARLARSGSGPSHIVKSGILYIPMIDPLTIPRKWSRTNGLGANIALDKDTYRVGEDIHLHAAVANFNAPAPVFSLFSFGPIQFDVLDAEGHALPENERFYGVPQTISTPPPPAIAKGTIVPLEVNLRHKGWLPNRPGTYTVVMTWSPSTNYFDPHTPDYYKGFLPFATVQARATIHIVEREPTQRLPHKRPFDDEPYSPLR